MGDKELILDTIAKSFNREVSQLNEDTRFTEDLHAKSTNYFMLIATLEDLSGKSVTYADLRDCATIGDIFSFLAELKKS